MSKKGSRDAPSYYTTFQVSKMLGVSLPTVVNWVDSGKLDAHRTPGGHRRISKQALLEFARAYDYPLGPDGPTDPHDQRRVLVVDDEQDFARMVQDYLTSKGELDVEIALSGFVAGFMVVRFKPDLILMDIMMPDMDGFEVLRMLRKGQETQHIPVIACTAYRDVEIERRIQQEDFDGFIQKPLKLKELLELINRRLGVDEQS